jgi:hypothetical protein
MRFLIRSAHKQTTPLVPDRFPLNLMRNQESFLAGMSIV